MATSLPEISDRRHGVIRNITGKPSPLVWLIRHPWACCSGIGLLSFLFLLQGALRSWPLPSNMDEFSVLVAADTFRHGRITNPTPPLFEHFETLHVFFIPTYASKYPPAAALLLCFAERVFGDPIWALWLSTAFACAALTWMLLAWFPLRWAYWEASSPCCTHSWSVGDAFICAAIWECLAQRSCWGAPSGSFAGAPTLVEYYWQLPWRRWPMCALMKVGFSRLGLPLGS
jgi:hypothetical protein